MKKIIAIKDFTLNGKLYKKDSEISTVNVKDLVKLNENGFIKPLTMKEIHNLSKQSKKEEEKNNE